MAELLLKRIKDWVVSITSFRIGDVIPVDGPSGTAKMSKDSLLEIAAQEAIAGNLTLSFDPSRTSENPYKEGQGVAYLGDVYIFTTDHYGPWNQSHVDRISDQSNPHLYVMYRGDVWRVSNLPENVLHKNDVRIPADASPNGGYIRLDDLALVENIKDFKVYEKTLSVEAGISRLLFTSAFSVKAGHKFKVRVTANDGAWSRFLLVPGNNQDDRTMDNLVSGETYEFVYDYDIRSMLYFMDANATTTEISVSVIAYPDVTYPSVLEFANFGVKSKNLLNTGDKDVELGYFITPSGSTQANSTYNASGYIPVEGNKTYCRSYAHNAAWYDEDKVFISAVTYSDGYVITAPNNARFIRLTFVAKDWMVSQFSEGSELSAFSKFGYYVEKENTLPDTRVQQASSRFGNSCEVLHADILTSGSYLQAQKTPGNNKRGLVLNAAMQVGSDFNSVWIGGDIWASYTAKIVVSTTSVTFIYKNGSGTEQTLSTNSHGLTISDFLRVASVVDDDGMWKVTITTADGAFTCSQQMNYSFNGTPYLMPIGASVSDVSFIVGNKDLNSPVFIFGDSYLGLADNVRSPYWLLQWGYDKGFYCGFPGAKSYDIIDDFRRALTVSKPKYVVWMLGMNDTYAQWLEYINIVKSWCNAYGVELIMSTIPIVPSQVSANTSINTYVTSSGYRYIDQNKAVGANSSGQWYSGMLADDAVHPTELGAKSIASQILMDFPELMEL